MAQQRTFAESIGFNRYHPHLAAAATAAMQTVSRNLIFRRWAVIGGAAVVHYAGMARRTISADIDILVTPDQLPVIRQQFPEVEASLFGLSSYCDGIYVDFVAAHNKFQRYAIADAGSCSFADMTLPIVSLNYLLVGKMLSGRMKDYRDFVILSQQQPVTARKARRLCKCHRNAIDPMISRISTV